MWLMSATQELSCRGKKFQLYYTLLFFDRDAGTRVFALSHDHKPNDEHEKTRITEAGGKIYW